MIFSTRSNRGSAHRSLRSTSALPSPKVVSLRSLKRRPKLCSGGCFSRNVGIFFTKLGKCCEFDHKSGTGSKEAAIWQQYSGCNRDQWKISHRDNMELSSVETPTAAADPRGLSGVAQPASGIQHYCQQYHRAAPGSTRATCVSSRVESSCSSSDEQPAQKRQRRNQNTLVAAAEGFCSAAQPAPPRLTAWIPVDLLVGQLVEVLRSNGTWSRGYILSVHTGGPQPYLVIRFVISKDWKRVSISEVGTKIRARSPNLEEPQVSTRSSAEQPAHSTQSLSRFAAWSGAARPG